MSSASRHFGAEPPKSCSGTGPACACDGSDGWRLELGDEALTFTVQAPGVVAADVDVFLDERALRVAVAAPGERLGADTARVQLLVALPVEVDADAARAELRRGVLRVTFPRRHQSSSRRIPVVSTDGGASAPTGAPEGTV